jgi:glycosyltransferase involved in cell wall biosynthesis
MIDLYSMSDLLLMPSRLESFGQTILEAQACNCPAITFKNTGCEDLVEHLKTGYLSEYMDQTDFSKGIEILLQTNFQNQIIRNSAKEKYSENIIGMQYKEILQNIFKF